MSELPLLQQVTWDYLTCDEIDNVGTRYWYDEDGELHREDGPAKVHINGTLSWYKHGSIHRAEGPAYIRYDGYAEYYIDGWPLSEEDFNARKLTING